MSSSNVIAPLQGNDKIVEELKTNPNACAVARKTGTTPKRVREAAKAAGITLTAKSVLGGKRQPQIKREWPSAGLPMIVI